MTTDIYTPSDNPYWLAPDPYDPEQIYPRNLTFTGVPPHFDPFNPEKYFLSSPTPSFLAGEPTPTIDPETSLWHGFSLTYPGDITKYHPFDPALDPDLDPESFFLGDSLPSPAEPAKFDPSDPKLHPRDPEPLDDRSDDQSPAKYVPLTSENYLWYGLSLTYPGDITKYHPFDPALDPELDPESFVPESFFVGSIIPSGEPAKFDPCDPPQDPELLDVRFDDQSPAEFDPSNPQIGVWDDFSPSYPGDPAKFHPFDPENFDAENFFLYGAYSCGEPSKLDPRDRKIHPRDLKMLGLDDQSPGLIAKVDGSVLVAGENDGGCVEGIGQPNKPTDTHDNTVSDGWGNFKGKSTIVESSGTAANKWNKKKSSSASKAAGNTPGEEETWERVGEEFSGETGHFARKCSLGADGRKSGGHGGGNIGRALCTRMP